MTYLGPQPYSLDQPVPKQTYQLGLIALDPGGTTGWSLMSLPANVFELGDVTKIFQHSLLWIHGEVDCRDINAGAFTLRKNLLDQWPSAAIVFESFALRGGSRQVDLTPVKLNSILGHHLWIRHREYHFQQPAMAKRMSNDRLKGLNVYTSQGGLEHARDADRHVVMMIRRCMENKGWKERLWPNVFTNKSVERSSN